MPTGELWSLRIGGALVVLAMVLLVLQLVMELTPAKRYVMPVSIANIHRVCVVALCGGILILVMVAAKWLGFLGT